MSPLALALRSLWRDRGFALVAVLVLTLGIGVNSTLFTMVDAVRFKPLPYPAAGQLVDLHEENPVDLCAGCSVGTAWATWRDWAEQVRSYEWLGAYTVEAMAIAGTEVPVRVRGARVTGGLLPTVGVAAAIGRGIAAGDDRPGAPPVVVLGHALWQREFGGERGVVGHVVRVNGAPHEVIGVMPEGFAFADADLWVPLPPSSAMDRTDRSVGVLGRLRAGTSVAQADAELRGITRGIAARYPADFARWEGRVSTLRAALAHDGGPPFEPLLGAAALVLLLACANLANLTLARATAREREFAVRAALGASRWQAMQPVLAEGLVVSLAGGGLSLLVASWMVRVVPRFLPDDMPRWIRFSVDGRVMAFTLVLAIASGLAVALLPARRLGRPDLHALLKDGARSAGPGRRARWTQGALVVTQVALALVVLSGAGLLVRTLLRVGGTSGLGYDPRTVLSARAELLDPRYADRTQVAAFGSRLLERLSQAPGVTGVALESSRFLGTFVGTEGHLTIEGSASAVPDAQVPRFAMAVTPDYFAIKGLRVVRGRGITAGDVSGGEGVVVLNEAAARGLLGDANPIGRRLKLAGPSADAPWLTVVGVVANSAESRLARTPPRFVYVAWAQDPGHPTIFVRANGDASLLAPLVKAAVAEVDPDQPLVAVETMATQLASYTAPVALFARLVGAMALFALLLAAVGLAGVVAQQVAHRTPEIGVRMALGATPGRILQLVVGQGVRLAAIGVLVGLVASLAFTRLLESMLYGTSPTDPLVLGLVVAGLLVVTGLAAALPARRATRVHPMRAIGT